MKMLENIILVAWDNGILMIGVFVLVVIVLIAAVMLLVNSSKKT